jgi:hypothetical protein
VQASKIAAASLKMLARELGFAGNPKSGNDLGRDSFARKKCGFWHALN